MVMKGRGRAWGAVQKAMLRLYILLSSTEPHSSLPITMASNLAALISFLILMTAQLGTAKAVTNGVFAHYMVGQLLVPSSRV